MRAIGAFFIALLLAAGFVFFLTGKKAEQDIRSLDHIADDLRDRNVDAAAFDHQAAARDVELISELAGRPAILDLPVGRGRVVAARVAHASGRLRSHRDDSSMKVTLRSTRSKVSR